MPSLLDVIRQPQVTGETGKLQRLLRAKSGREVAGPEVGVSALGEEQAVAQAQQQIQQQVLPQAQIQEAGTQAQQAQQQTQAGIQRQEIEQTRKFDTVQSRIRTDQLLQDMEQKSGEIDLQRDRAQITQLAHGLRFQNSQYIDNLQREGQRARLDSGVRFNEELAATIFGDSQELLEKNLENQSVINASERDFRKAMAVMGMDDAYSLFRSEMRAEKERAMWTGIGGLATAGIAAAGTATPRVAAPAITPTTSTYGTTVYGGGGIET